jgi:hypothetical protein
MWGAGAKMMPTLKYVTSAYVSVRYPTAKPFSGSLIHSTLNVYDTCHLLRRSSYWLLIGSNILHTVRSKSPCTHSRLLMGFLMVPLHEPAQTT